MFLHIHVPDVEFSEGILFQKILIFLQPTGKTFPALYPLLTFGLLYTQAITLTQFINSRRLTNTSTYLPGMSYMLITSLFPEWNYFSAPLIINTILLLILYWLFKISSQQNAKANIYNIGLVLGVASFLFFSSLTFILWIFFALAVMRPFRLNEWLLCILGITTPYYFYGIYLFLSNQWSWDNLLPYFSLSIPDVRQSAWIAGSTFLIAVPFLVGGYYVQENLRRMLIHVRKGWSLLLLYLLAAIFVPFLNANHSFGNWIMSCIPFAAFHACAYLYSKWKIFPLILFWLSVAFVIAYEYYGPGW